MALTVLSSQFDEFDLSRNDYLTFNSQSERSRTPRYLFRIFTSKSQARTNTSWALSMDAASSSANCTVDIFERSDQDETANMIYRHLDWKKGHYDNLVSWTSSLLHALVYIFYLHAKTGNKVIFRDIFLCVIDTRGLPNDVFIRDMELVAAFRHTDFKRYERFQNMREKFYFGKYLTQGALKIEGRCQIIRTHLIIEKGLGNIVSDFGECARWDPEHVPRWASKSLEIRQRIFKLEKSERPGITRDGLEAALAIARIFETPWRLPIAASLVALAAPRTDDDTVWAAFRSPGFTNAARRDCSLQDTRFDELSEVNEYLDIMRRIYKDEYLTEFMRRLDSAESALRNLSVLRLSEEFLTHETSHTEPTISSMDVSDDTILSTLDTIRLLSNVLHKRLSTGQEQSLEDGGFAGRSNL